jgi:hypothetical protein
MISVSDIIGKNSAILHSDGLKLYEVIKSNIGKGIIDLSFKGIVHCTTAFLNASIGKLLVENPNFLSYIKCRDIADDFISEKIKLVISNAIDEKRRKALEDSARGYFHQ